MFQKKSLGQNFLTSTHIVGDIVAASAIVPSDVVLEIGPGKGVLTKALLKSGASVVVVEKDNRLIPILKNTFSSYIEDRKLTILHGDALECKPEEIMRDKKYKVVANIPYYITGALIRKFFESSHQPTLMTLMLQKEVAERIVARDGRESLLSMSVKVYGTPRLIKKVSKGSFSPAPTVDSAILTVSDISKKNFDAISESDFFSVLKKGFAHKRKILAANLELSLEKRVSIFEQIGLNIKARAEELTLSDWKKLVALLQR